jgi:hypothetical protein
MSRLDVAANTFEEVREQNLPAHEGDGSDLASHEAVDHELQEPGGIGRTRGIDDHREHSDADASAVRRRAAKQTKE